MEKVYPCLEADLSKLIHNVKEIVSICDKKDIKVTAVTKVFCAYRPIVEAILEGGVNELADSRILNLKKMEDLNCKKTLLRIPMVSECYEVVKYSDMSLNSEIDTIKKLSMAAVELNKVHDILLMVDIGDLREGVLVEDTIDTVRQIITLDNINLVGLGTNVTCYGGLIPDTGNLGKLISLKHDIKNIFNLDLSIISGGNSSSLYMVINDTIPKEVNNLRIGESIVLGVETAYGELIPNCYKDAFILKSEIIELKYKPSVPKGNIGLNSFGEKPQFEDKGIRKRAIVALGKQDVRIEGLTPVDENISIFGASSDHLILDVTDSKEDLKVGDIVEFKLSYGTLLSAMTSPYIEKSYKDEEIYNYI